MTVLVGERVHSILTRQLCEELILLYKVSATDHLAILNHNIPQLLKFITDYIPTYCEVYCCKLYRTLRITQSLSVSYRIASGASTTDRFLDCVN
jgi:hypothetical protein